MPITIRQIFSFALVASLLALPALAEPTADAEPTSDDKAAQPPTTQPTAKTIPDESLKEFYGFFSPPPRGMQRSEVMTWLEKQMLQAYEAGQKIEKEYPNAPRLHLVRNRMLFAAERLSMINRTDEEYQKNLLAIAGRIVQSDAPADEKVNASFYLTRAKIEKSPKKVGEIIKDMVAGFEKTDGHKDALMAGTILALQNKQDDLRKQFVGVLQKQYTDDPMIHGFLYKIAKATDEEVVFRATLTTVDGKTLKLPEDMKGKVVVVDFWATWCGPCIQEIPHMKKVYSEYKDKGVEFVGISLDAPNRRMPTQEEVEKHFKNFIKTKGLSWVHTVSYKGWSDPTVQAYNVRGIPSIWVIGHDGVVISDSARGNLEGTLDQALKRRDEAKPAKATAAKAKE